MLEKINFTSLSLFFMLLYELQWLYCVHGCRCRFWNTLKMICP